MPARQRQPFDPVAGVDGRAGGCPCAAAERCRPRVQVVEFEGLGHMGPITHPEIVNKTICRFLEQEG
jgi:pimeloyl-ACP methyl ester carboxylesterase